VSNDLVSRLEKKIDELLARQDRLARENKKLVKAQQAYANDRKRCRKELDSILAKLDQLG
jgi:outer membrane murein-binding lipoprotein Lpp